MKEKSCGSVGMGRGIPLEICVQKIKMLKCFYLIVERISLSPSALLPSLPSISTTVHFRKENHPGRTEGG